jgi:hypothetical protein
MVTAGTMNTPDSSTPDDVALQSSDDGLVMVFSCSRLGRHANPPQFSFPEWLRVGRRR